jgi:diguanylate cyclase (GGDEF)-like protein
VTDAGRQRVLVIEDDPEIQYILSVILADEGREIVVAENAVDARREMAAGDLDLVILDLILPDADGRTLLAELRAARATAAVPVVVSTARAAPEIRQECYSLGADAFIEKPFDPAELQADLGARLERQAAAERAALSDPVTGLLNRAGLQASCSDFEVMYGIGVIQLDDFGEHSERWGWDKSERIVKEVAGALRGAISEEFTLGRLGGAEFALVAQDADLEVVSLVAAEALRIVRELRPGELEADETRLTATIGVCTANPGDPFEESLEVARQRIFQARAEAGDKVVAEDTITPSDGRVLVAEDDEISATILLHRLEKEGLDVVRFDNGQEAYEEALREVPALVILDVKMPGLDGFEVLERLRKDHRFSRVPVIMLTSMGQEADIVRAFRVGADDYILKPFSPTELSARVRRLLTRGRSAASI